MGAPAVREARRGPSVFSQPGTAGAKAPQL